MPMDDGVGYNAVVLRHFQSPSNVGKIEEPDGVGDYASDVCGDLMRLYLKVLDNKIIDAKFQCFGCAGSLACGSVLTEIIMGKVIEIAERMKEADILNALGGLPEHKAHCATLAIGALRKAIESHYRGRYLNST